MSDGMSGNWAGSEARREAAIAREDQPQLGEVETECPAREDGQHCNCWYDGKKCCACGEK